MNIRGSANLSKSENDHAGVSAEISGRELRDGATQPKDIRTRLEADRRKQWTHCLAISQRACLQRTSARLTPVIGCTLQIQGAKRRRLAFKGVCRIRQSGPVRQKPIAGIRGIVLGNWRLHKRVWTTKVQTTGVVPRQLQNSLSSLDQQETAGCFLLFKIVEDVNKPAFSEQIRNYNAPNI